MVSRLHRKKEGRDKAPQESPVPIEISAECSDLLKPFVAESESKPTTTKTRSPREILSREKSAPSELKRPPTLDERVSPSVSLTGASDLLSGIEPLSNPSPSPRQLQRPPTPISAPRRQDESSSALRQSSDALKAEQKGPSNYSDRRRQRRMPFDDQIEIWQRGPAGRANRFAAWGLNISAGGIRVIFTRELARGERVGIQLRRDRNALPGRVAWVKPQADGCIAGISFSI